ncbi:hypothetical protein GCM10009850_106880 [Nonomuraea monospora]|uniref:Uncharacterized protein n=1 Tax=Nonomuraea monospora TaxID=568818 RepID=A0ABP5PU32_9ACTN
MSDFAEFRARGRAALLAGQATHDVPFADGGTRWGTTAAFRPQQQIAERMAELSATVSAPGHWVHGAGTLHVTLRTLERYRTHIPQDDPLCRAYGSALAEAVAGLPPARVRLAGVHPHPGGVVVGAHPEDDTLDTIRKRFAHVLETRGIRDVERGRVRDRWYVSLVHFAAPLTNAGELVAWCDAHADADFGTAELRTAEIVQFVHTGGGVRVNSLERAVLGEGGGAPPRPHS